MFVCKACDEEFEFAAFYTERHGFADGRSEEIPVCPNCGSEWFFEELGADAKLVL